GSRVLVHCEEQLLLLRAPAVTLLLYGSKGIGLLEDAGYVRLEIHGLRLSGRSSPGSRTRVSCGDTRSLSLQGESRWRRTCCPSARAPAFPHPEARRPPSASLPPPRSQAPGERCARTEARECSSRTQPAPACCSGAPLAPLDAEARSSTAP